MEALKSTAEIDTRRYGRPLSRTLPRVIQSDQQHEQMLSDIERLMDKGDQRKPEEDALLNLMVVLVGDYEERRYPLPEAEPREMLKHLLEERGLKQRGIRK